VQSVVVYAYVTACGFVLAGVPASFVQLVSGQPMIVHLDNMGVQ
jgi:predicted benzoate:H+ symporter BenE